MKHMLISSLTLIPQIYLFYFVCIIITYFGTGLVSSLLQYCSITIITTSFFTESKSMIDRIQKYYPEFNPSLSDYIPHEDNYSE